MGRPKKKHDDPEMATKELIEKAMSLYIEPYDDRIRRNSLLPSVRFVSEQLETTVLRTRKLLITGGYYSTSLSRQIETLMKSGKSIEDIMNITGLKKASVNSYIPYRSIAFNLPQTTVNADRHKIFRKRKKAVQNLKSQIDSVDTEEFLWDAILAFEHYPFKTVQGLKYSYQIKMGRDGLQNDELIFNRKMKTITKATVVLAFRRALEIQHAEGMVSGPKKLGVFGASYIYPIFLRLGIISAS